MGVNKKEKEFVLSDNSIWTANSLAKELNISSATARHRLKTHTDIDIIMRTCERSAPTRTYRCKKFKLSDGSELDARSCAKRFDINISTMYARLLRGIRDVDKLGEKSRTKNSTDATMGYVPFEKQTESVKKMQKRRNFYDPLSRLLLKTI